MAIGVEERVVRRAGRSARRAECGRAAPARRRRGMRLRGVIGSRGAAASPGGEPARSRRDRRRFDQFGGAGLNLGAQRAQAALGGRILAPTPQARRQFLRQFAERLALHRAEPRRLRLGRRPLAKRHDIGGRQARRRSNVGARRREPAASAARRLRPERHFRRPRSSRGARWRLQASRLQRRLSACAMKPIGRSRRARAK